MNGMVKKLAAEFIGTFALVFFGCGAAVLAGFGAVGQLGIALAFGLTIVAMAYSLGPVSGCHLNPAVSFALFVAGRMSRTDLWQYALAQCFGALVGAGALYLIASGSAYFDPNTPQLGQNGYGAGSPGQYPLWSGMIFEVLATFLFALVILGATQGEAAPFAGIAIGLALAVIHIVGIQITGVSVNPARSLGPALLAGGSAMQQLWLFIFAPLLGAALAGFAHRLGLLTPDE
ncbi:MAG: MIP family channel protein [Hyphomonadaceae bacterium]|nr:MIP family channel protein [Hyphomonadaceae bacterium]